MADFKVLKQRAFKQLEEIEKDIDILQKNIEKYKNILNSVNSIEEAENHPDHDFSINDGLVHIELY